MSEREVTEAIRQLLREKIFDLNITHLPNEKQWYRFVDAVVHELSEREQRNRALEEVATSSTPEELTHIRESLSKQYADLEEMLDLLANAVRVYRDAVGGDQGALTEAIGLARHRFSVQLQAENTDELGLASRSGRALQHSLVNLSDAIADLVQEASTVAAGRKELELAGAVQKMLVPASQGVRVAGARVYSWFQPAEQCGGDWWTAHSLTQDRGLVIIGDVTGHGASSAIITGAIKGACDLARMGMRHSLRPSLLMRMLNQVISEAARGEYMMTSLALTISRVDTPKVLLSNAGHQAPWLLRDGKLTVVQGVREPPLGAQMAVPYTEIEVRAQAGDLLVLQTDGMTEAENPAGEEMGEKGLRALCEEHAHLGAEALRDKIREAVHQYVADRDQLDDICLVVIEIL